MANNFFCFLLTDRDDEDVDEDEEDHDVDGMS